MIPKTNMPVTWTKPELVCEIKYSEITKDGIFRHPVFVAVREDKSPEEITDSPINEKPNEMKAKAPSKKNESLRKRKRNHPE
nr:hypothetical protein [Chryseobacterium sp. P1-3]